MHLLWKKETNEVFGESVMFAACREIQLLFPVKKLLRVSCPARKVIYTEGKDFLWTPGSRTLTRTPHSVLPFITEEALHPQGPGIRTFPQDAGHGENAIEGGPGETFLIFNNQDYFARHQLEVDYIAETIDLPFPEVPFPGRLPRTKQRLQEAQSLRITWMGDSISEGFNASAYIQHPPFQPPFAGLTARELQYRFGAPVELRNRGVNGSGSIYPLLHYSQWRGDHPDLMVIAYGMNDFSAIPEETYLQNLADIMALNAKESPHTEYLLVASMSGNPVWKYTPPEKARCFAEKLREFAAHSPVTVGFADLHEVWNRFLERKSFLDLTGNGVNHPNDFGHRILAEGVIEAICR